LFAVAEEGKASGDGLERFQKEVMRMGSILKMDRIEIFAASAGLFFASVTTFVGLIAIPFAGTGPEGYLKALSILFGFELPVYIVFFFISRKALTCACWAMFAIDYVVGLLFRLSEGGFGKGVLGILVIIPWENLPGILIPLVATYLYKEEKRRLAGDWSL
jgi:hypothetical protein